MTKVSGVPAFRKSSLGIHKKTKKTTTSPVSLQLTTEKCFCHLRNMSPNIQWPKRNTSKFNSSDESDGIWIYLSHSYVEQHADFWMFEAKQPFNVLLAPLIFTALTLSALLNFPSESWEGQLLLSWVVVHYSHAVITVTRHLLHPLKHQTLWWKYMCPTFNNHLM